MSHPKLALFLPVLLALAAPAPPAVEGEEPAAPPELLRPGFVTAISKDGKTASVSAHLAPEDLADSELMASLQAAGYVAKGGVPVVAVSGVAFGEGPNTLRVAMPGSYIADDEPAELV